MPLHIDHKKQGPSQKQTCAVCGSVTHWPRSGETRQESPRRGPVQAPRWRGLRGGGPQGRRAKDKETKQGVEQDPGERKKKRRPVVLNLCERISPHPHTNHLYSTAKPHHCICVVPNGPRGRATANIRAPMRPLQLSTSEFRSGSANYRQRGQRVRVQTRRGQRGRGRWRHQAAAVTAGGGCTGGVGMLGQHTNVCATLARL